LEMHHGHSATLKRMKEVFWISKDFDVRSWMSTSNFSVHLCSFLSKNHFILLDLYSNKIWAYQVTENLPELCARHSKCFAILADSS
jgi:hypothetical protein